MWKAGVLREILQPHSAVIVRGIYGLNSNRQMAGTATSSFEPPDTDRPAIRLRPVPRRAGDTNCDSVVNPIDLINVLTNWGVHGVDADLDTSGAVNVTDLLMVINNWG